MERTGRAVRAAQEPPVPRFHSVQFQLPWSSAVRNINVRLDLEREHTLLAVVVNLPRCLIHKLNSIIGMYVCLEGKHNLYKGPHYISFQASTGVLEQVPPWNGDTINPHLT